MEAIFQGFIIAGFVILSGIFIRCGEILYDLAELKDYLKYFVMKAEQNQKGD